MFEGSAPQRRSSARWALALTVAIAGSLGAAGRRPSAAQVTGTVGLPDSAGAETVRARCSSCHESDLIEEQRLSRDGWDRELTKMVRWGATVGDSERAALLDYLVRHFGQRPSGEVAPEVAARAETLLRGACSGCHERDLIESQRLSAAGWTRELDKMIRWGASVTDADKTSLAGYLASLYGPRPAGARR
ncbi:MAG: hypothetical protein U0Q12_24810 [Vicinamibacterales bacterium]